MYILYIYEEIYYKAWPHNYRDGEVPLSTN